MLVRPKNGQAFLKRAMVESLSRCIAVVDDDGDEEEGDVDEGKGGVRWYGQTLMRISCAYVIR